MTIFDRPSLRSTVLGIGAAGAAVALVTACSSSGGSSTAVSSTPAGAASTPAAAGSAPAAGGAPIMTASNALGTIVVDAQGRTVYDFAPDTPTTSNCNGACATAWPPVAAPASLPASVPGITGALTSITRSDGSKQLALNGHPLYTFVADKAPGQTNGEGKNALGGLWLVLTPAGAEIPAKSGSASASASSSSKAGGGYGY